MERYDFEKRKFKFWFYHVTHREAIVRSLKTNCLEKNIDIYFGDIQYIEMPTSLADFRMENANDADIMYLEEKIGRPVQPQNVTVLTLEERRFYVVASISKIVENSLEMNELPISTFMKGVEL